MAINDSICSVGQHGQLNLLLMVQKTPNTSWHREASIFSLFVSQVSCNYPLVIWIFVHQQYQSTFIAALDSVWPTGLCLCESIAWMKFFSWPAWARIEKKLGKNLGIWRVTLKRVHPSKRCHLQVGWFSQDNFLPPPVGWFCGKQNIPGVQV